MSLEQAIEANTAALLKLAAAMATSGPSPTPQAPVTTTTTKAPTAAEKKAAEAAAAKAKKEADAAAAAAAKQKEPESEYTREGMVTLLAEIKEKTGNIEDARAIIKEVGGVDKMKDIPDSKIDEVYLAAKAKYDELNGDDDGM